MCLVKDPAKRPSAEKLLRHYFFKQARSVDYLARRVLHGLPPLGERVKKLKVPFLVPRVRIIVHCNGFLSTRLELIQMFYSAINWKLSTDFKNCIFMDASCVGSYGTLYSLFYTVFCLVQTLIVLYDTLKEKENGFQ